jgi:hypothetical protein
MAVSCEVFIEEDKIAYIPFLLRVPDRRDLRASGSLGSMSCSSSVQVKARVTRSESRKTKFCKDLEQMRNKSAGNLSFCRVKAQINGEI